MMITKDSRSSILWYVIPILYSLYYLQGILYDRGLFSLIAISLLLLLGIFFCIKTFIVDSTRPRPLVTIFIFLSLVTVSYILSPKYVKSSHELQPLSTFIQFKDLLIFFLSIFTGYQIGLTNRLKNSQLIICCTVFFILAILYFIRMNAILYAITHRNEITNNAGYFFVAILPYFILLLKEKKILGWLFIAVSVIFITYTFKRGAIIITAVILIYVSTVGNSKKSISLKGILFAFVLMSCAVYFFLTVMESSEFMAQRVRATLAGDSSSRDTLYSYLWNEWLNADVLHQLFGFGMSQTVTFAGNYAHNDWLEILINYGFFGVILYACILVQLFKYRKNLNYNKWFKLCYTSIMLTWIMKTLFSMGIGVPESLSIILLGSLIGNSVSHYRVLVSNTNESSLSH